MEVTQENVNKLVNSTKIEMKTSDLNKYMEKSQDQIENLAYEYIKNHPEIEDMSEMKKGFEEYLASKNLTQASPDLESQEEVDERD